MDKRKMNTVDIDATRARMLDCLEDFSQESTRYYVAMESIMANPNMRGLFLSKADQMVKDVKGIETRLKLYIEDLAFIIKDAVEMSTKTEAKFSVKFQDLNSDDFLQVPHDE